MELAVLNNEGKEVGKLAVKEDILGGASNKKLLYQVLKAHLANQRQGSASTKTRAEVSGGGRKPWRQKGTGRARVGSTRSPLWRKGGVTFGPHPRDFHYSVPDKMKKGALRSALNAKLSDKAVILLNEIVINEPKTKLLASLLSKVSKEGKIMLAIKEKNENLLRAGRNISRLKISRASDLTAYDVLACNKLIIVKEAFGVLEARLQG